MPGEGFAGCVLRLSNPLNDGAKGADDEGKDEEHNEEPLFSHYNGRRRHRRVPGCQSSTVRSLPPPGMRDELADSLDGPCHAHNHEQSDLAGGQIGLGGQLSFAQAIRTCLVSKYGEFSGRAPRAEYWWFILFGLLITIPFLALGVATGQPLFFLIPWLALILPTLAVTVRRLHDSGRSGWNYLWNLLPFGSLVLLYFLLAPSKDGPNVYALERAHGRIRWNDQLDLQTASAILGITPHASAADIRAAYADRRRGLPMRDRLDFLAELIAARATCLRHSSTPLAAEPTTLAVADARKSRAADLLGVPAGADQDTVMVARHQRHRELSLWLYDGKRRRLDHAEALLLSPPLRQVE